MDPFLAACFSLLKETVGFFKLNKWISGFLAACLLFFWVLASSNFFDYNHITFVSHGKPIVRNLTEPLKLGLIEEPNGERIYKYEISFGNYSSPCIENTEIKINADEQALQRFLQKWCQGDLLPIELNEYTIKLKQVSERDNQLSYELDTKTKWSWRWFFVLIGSIFLIALIYKVIEPKISDEKKKGEGGTSIKM
ncbi:MAG: hypothetical protein V1837_05890 [Candidatus Woesearchaeota archaeon]